MTPTEKKPDYRPHVGNRRWMDQAKEYADKNLEAAMKFKVTIELDEEAMQLIIAKQFGVNADDVRIICSRELTGVGPMECEISVARAKVEVRGTKAIELMKKEIENG